MARASVDVDVVDRDGFNLSAANKTTIASADGIEFTNTGTEFLYLENTDAGDVVVTIQIGKTVDGLTVTDRTVTLQEQDTAGDIQLVGPFPVAEYNQGGGKVYVDVDTDAVVEAIALRLTTS